MAIRTALLVKLIHHFQSKLKEKYNLDSELNIKIFLKKYTSKLTGTFKTVTSCCLMRFDSNKQSTSSL